MRRYELSEAQFASVEDTFPKNGSRGGQWNDHRMTLNGIFWILHSGAQWREMPERYGNWKSVYDRFRRWRMDGTIDRILKRLHLKLNEEGYTDPSLRCTDATLIRASRSAAGALKKKRAQRAG